MADRKSASMKGSGGQERPSDESLLSTSMMIMSCLAPLKTKREGMRERERKRERERDYDDVLLKFHKSINKR